MFLVDTCIILAGFAVFGLERGLFAIIQLYLSSQMINFMVMSIGTKYAKTAYIISERHQRIGERIIKELHHGGTLLTGVGIFTGQQRTILLAVVHNQQINRLLRIVQDEDPNAFVFVHETYQVMGEGFVPMARILNRQTVEKKEKKS